MEPEPESTEGVDHKEIEFKTPIAVHQQAIHRPKSWMEVFRQPGYGAARAAIWPLPHPDVDRDGSVLLDALNRPPRDQDSNGQHGLFPGWKR